MLEIYFEDELDNIDKSLIQKDVEQIFWNTKIADTNNINHFISSIDLGKYNDTNSFIDRFGTKLPITNLSTGCKAAICVELHPDIIIDLLECGLNAVDEIINFCENGKIIIRDTGVTFRYLNNDKCNVKLDNYRFTSVLRLNKYIQDERPFEPDMTCSGIERLY